MDGTVLQQGTFLANSTGLVNPAGAGVASRAQANPTIVAIPSNADWMVVKNFTQWGTVGAAGGAYFNGTANADVGIEFYWQRGMPAGAGIVQYKAAASAVISGDTFGTAGSPVIYSGGFTLYDPSGQSAGALPLLGSPVATTASTNVTRPVVSTGSTAGLAVGSVVRMSNTAQTDVNGIDMVVGAVVANTSFTLLTATNPLATAPGVVGGAGFYRIVNANPLFYPRRRYVVNITQAVNAQVSTSVAHGLTPGQAIRFEIPAVSGMIQLNATPANNYLAATILSVVDDYNFTINIDTTAFTAFTWPTSIPNQLPVSFPSITPFGEDTAQALINTGSQVPTIAGQQIFNTQTGILADSTVNTGYLGMILGAGGNGLELTTPILGPSGSLTYAVTTNALTPDLMYWVAGKSQYGGL